MADNYKHIRKWQKNNPDKIQEFNRRYDQRNRKRRAIAKKQTTNDLRLMVHQ